VKNKSQEYLEGAIY